MRRAGRNTGRFDSSLRSKPNSVRKREKTPEELQQEVRDKKLGLYKQRMKFKKEVQKLASSIGETPRQRAIRIMGNLKNWFKRNRVNIRNSRSLKRGLARLKRISKSSVIAVQSSLITLGYDLSYKVGNRRHLGNDGDPGSKTRAAIIAYFSGRVAPSSRSESTSRIPQVSRSLRLRRLKNQRESANGSTRKVLDIRINLLQGNLALAAIGVLRAMADPSMPNHHKRQVKDIYSIMNRIKSYVDKDFAKQIRNASSNKMLSTIYQSYRSAFKGDIYLAYRSFKYYVSLRRSANKAVIKTHLRVISRLLMTRTVAISKQYSSALKKQGFLYSVVGLRKKEAKIEEAISKAVNQALIDGNAYDYESGLQYLKRSHPKFRSGQWRRYLNNKARHITPYILRVVGSRNGTNFNKQAIIDLAKKTGSESPVLSQSLLLSVISDDQYAQSYMSQEMMGGEEHTVMAINSVIRKKLLSGGKSRDAVNQIMAKIKPRVRTLVFVATTFKTGNFGLTSSGRAYIRRKFKEVSNSGKTRNAMTQLLNLYLNGAGKQLVKQVFNMLTKKGWVNLGRTLSSKKKLEKAYKLIKNLFNFSSFVASRVNSTSRNRAQFSSDYSSATIPDRKRRTKVRRRASRNVRLGSAIESRV